MEKDVFYTLTGYQKKDDYFLTHAMEDYLEMIYRIFDKKKEIHMKDLASNLHVQASSVTKMMIRLKKLELISFEKYGQIYLTERGKIYGKYLLHRHDVLVQFFTFLNQENYDLEQVEKIEHFVDFITVENIEKLIKKITEE